MLDFQATFRVLCIKKCTCYVLGKDKARVAEDSMHHPCTINFIHQKMGKRLKYFWRGKTKRTNMEIAGK